MMIPNRRVYSIGVLFLVAILSLWGCPKKTEVASEAQSPSEAQKGTVTTPTPQVQQAPEAKPEEPKEQAATAAEGLTPVYFDFDKSFIREDAKDVMKANAEWLKAHPKVKIKIEGNCDERGTREYNQALGQRRALSAKRYLTDLGISGRRIALISYGKEKPACTENTENCWQKNRRDDFTVTD